MPNRESHKSLGRACLIAPLIAPALYYIGALIVMIIEPNNKVSFISAFIFIMSIGIPVSYVATLVLGLPVYQILKNKGLLSLTSISIGGVLLGALVLLLFFGSVSTMNVLEFLSVSAIGATLGGSVALAFGIISGITRPSIGRSR
jgi:hypothetical protein